MTATETEALPADLISRGRNYGELALSVLLLLLGVYLIIGGRQHHHSRLRQHGRASVLSLPGRRGDGAGRRCAGGPDLPR